jgi:aminopeptidase N
VEAYRVALAPDLATQTLVATTTLRIRPGDDPELSFPLAGLTVDRVSASGAQVTFTNRDGLLAFRLPSPAAPGGPVEVTVAYHGAPAKGLVWGPRSVHTTFHACGWMVCDPDRPGDRAALELELVVPEDLDVVASGVEVASVPAGPGLVRHTWRQTRPYPSYLFAFAVGRFVRVALPSRPPGLEVVAEGMPPVRLAALFGETEQMRDFFEEKAGVPLPHRYTQVLVDGDEAQEASSLSFLGREFVEPILDDPHEDWAAAHELSHQWWGNLLTCASWQHFWLNEGMATFLTAAWKERRWGRADYERELRLARESRQAAAEAGFDVPLAWAGPYPSLGMRRRIVYAKGALFLDALRRTLGEAAFWDGLRRYTRENVDRSVESRDLQRAMEVASGRDLSALFREWVYGP